MQSKLIATIFSVFLSGVSSIVSAEDKMDDNSWKDYEASISCFDGAANNDSPFSLCNLSKQQRIEDADRRARTDLSDLHKELLRLRLLEYLAREDFEGAQSTLNELIATDAQDELKTDMVHRFNELFADDLARQRLQKEIETRRIRSEKTGVISLDSIPIGPGGQIQQ
jgi:hypothetical protein